MKNDDDREAIFLLLQAFAGAVEDVEKCLQELPDLSRLRCLPLSEYTWQRVEAHLSSPLAGLPETPETSQSRARGQALAYVIANSLHEYLELSRSSE